MQPLQPFHGYGHMLLVGTVRTGKSHLLMQLQLSALETAPAPPVAPTAAPPTRYVPAWVATFGKEPG